MAKKTNTGKLNKNLLLVLLGLVIIVIVASGTWYWNAQNNKQQPAQSDNTEKINLDPPTEEELKETEEHKKNLGDSANNPDLPTDANGKKIVTPVITTVTASQVNAFVPGVFEEGGTCTATLTKAGQTITASSTAFQNVSYTSCAPIALTAQASPGTWSAVITYSSSTSQGSSAAKDFVVN